MKAHYTPYRLVFYKPAQTSREILTSKETFILTLQHEGKKGVGECALFRGLSAEDPVQYKKKLDWLCENISLDPSVISDELRSYPSLWTGYEQAIRNMKYGQDLYFPSAFTETKDSIKINGLIWMGEPDFMKNQIQEKIAENYTCIKLKIGAFWDKERDLLRHIRRKYSVEQLEIRVDANGAFGIEEAPKILEELARLNIHSIEQPIKPKREYEMKKLCKNSPLPIALDEELIGRFYPKEKKAVLEYIRPQYIILKPSLIGGFSGCNEWIALAEKMNIGWWITSALESNIGLNALSQYTYTKKNTLPQGLGTGALFSNNFRTPLLLKNDRLWYTR
ncbi:MAG: o-succinylbenzoate synthase [Bergeyella sp.]|nr:o-succinylbenzoate synthase [Bergeyella sp.]